MHRQVSLYDPETQAWRLCWLPVDKRIKRGAKVTLKEEPERVWTVSWVSELTHDAQKLHRTWNNNI